MQGCSPAYRGKPGGPSQGFLSFEALQGAATSGLTAETALIGFPEQR